MANRTGVAGMFYNGRKKTGTTSKDVILLFFPLWSYKNPKDELRVELSYRQVWVCPSPVTLHKMSQD